MLERVRARAAACLPKVCLLSGGETTVAVTGTGTGGRNQEFALALAGSLADVPAAVVVASVGTDGIDGPTDAAGALVDNTTVSAGTPQASVIPAAF